MLTIITSANGISNFVSGDWALIPVWSNGVFFEEFEASVGWRMRESSCGEVREEVRGRSDDIYFRRPQAARTPWRRELILTAAVAVVAFVL